MKKPSKGLGDSIEKVLKTTGISKLFGDDCGCEERKKKLNQMFPYSRPFTDDEMDIYESVLPRLNKGTITGSDQAIMIKLYNKVFNTNKKTSGCSSCVKATLDKLETVYKNSCKNG